MASGDAEPVPGGSGPPSPHRTDFTDQFSTLFKQACLSLKLGYAITDLQGLEYVGQLLYQVVRFEAFKNNTVPRMALLFTETKLGEIVEVLRNFRPMVHETTDGHMNFCLRLNFPLCFDDLLTYIAGTTKHLLSEVQESAAGANLLLHLQQLKGVVTTLGTLVDKKFSGSSLGEGSMDEVHWITLVNYGEEEYLPSGLITIFKEFPKSKFPLPPWLYPLNTQLIDTLRFKAKPELQNQAPGQVCGICGTYVACLINMSFLQDCAHVFCIHCLKKWLFEDSRDNWMCPACMTPTDCYGIIKGWDAERSASFLIPPHGQIMTMTMISQLPVKNRPLLG